MASRVVTDEQGRRDWIRFIEGHDLPFSSSIVKGKKRSWQQNKLQRLWVGEIAEQKGDETPEEIRGFCKLTIGVPILRQENDDFREKYDRIIRPLQYEQKLEMMMEPLDFPVTRLMTSKQKTQYLDEISRYWSSKGYVLTDPEGRGR